MTGRIQIIENGKSVRTRIIMSDTHDERMNLTTKDMRGKGGLNKPNPSKMELPSESYKAKMVQEDQED